MSSDPVVVRRQPLSGYGRAVAHQRAQKEIAEKQLAQRKSEMWMSLGTAGLKAGVDVGLGYLKESALQEERAELRAAAKEEKKPYQKANEFSLDPENVLMPDPAWEAKTRRELTSATGPKAQKDGILMGQERGVPRDQRRPRPSKSLIGKARFADDGLTPAEGWMYNQSMKRPWLFQQSKIKNTIETADMAALNRQDKAGAESKSQQQNRQRENYIRDKIVAQRVAIASGRMKSVPKDAPGQRTWQANNRSKTMFAAEVAKYLRDNEPPAGETDPYYTLQLAAWNHWQEVYPASYQRFLDGKPVGLDAHYSMDDIASMYTGAKMAKRDLNIHMGPTPSDVPAVGASQKISLRMAKQTSWRLGKGVSYSGESLDFVPELMTLLKSGEESLKGLKNQVHVPIKKEDWHGRFGHPGETDEQTTQRLESVLDQLADPFSFNSKENANRDRLVTNNVLKNGKAVTRRPKNLSTAQKIANSRFQQALIRSGVDYHLGKPSSGGDPVPLDIEAQITAYKTGLTDYHKIQYPKFKTTLKGKWAKYNPVAIKNLKATLKAARGGTMVSAEYYVRDDGGEIGKAKGSFAKDKWQGMLGEQKALIWEKEHGFAPPTGEEGTVYWDKVRGITAESHKKDSNRQYGILKTKINDSEKTDAQKTILIDKLGKPLSQTFIPKELEGKDERTKMAFAYAQAAGDLIGHTPEQKAQNFDTLLSDNGWTDSIQENYEMLERLNLVPTMTAMG